MIKIKNVLADSNINNERQIELDIARGLAVIFMVIIHLQMDYSLPSLQNSILGQITDFLGGIPAAPVFMFLMGAGFIYSKKTDKKYFIKRGLIILVLGYALNFYRGSFVDLVDYFIEGSPDSLTSAILSFIEIDILHFAGLSMIIFGLIKKLKTSTICTLTTMAICSIAAEILSTYEVKGFLLTGLTGLIWGSSHVSAFPLLNWIFYPLLGSLFARLLIRCNNKNKFYLHLILLSFALLIISITFSKLFKISLGFSSELAYYHHNFLANITYSSFVIVWIGILHYTIKIFPQKWITTLKRGSSNVTEIYIIHWIILGWLCWIIDESSLNISGFVIVSFIIYITSDRIAYFLNKRNMKI